MSMSRTGTSGTSLSNTMSGTMSGASMTTSSGAFSDTMLVPGSNSGTHGGSASTKTSSAESMTSEGFTRGESTTGPGESQRSGKAVSAGGAGASGAESRTFGGSSRGRPMGTSSSMRRKRGPSTMVKIAGIVSVVVVLLIAVFGVVKWQRSKAAAAEQAEQAAAADGDDDDGMDEEEESSPGSVKGASNDEAKGGKTNVRAEVFQSKQTQGGSGKQPQIIKTAADTQGDGKMPDKFAGGQGQDGKVASGAKDAKIAADGAPEKSEQSQSRWWWQGQDDQRRDEGRSKAAATGTGSRQSMKKGDQLADGESGTSGTGTQGKPSGTFGPGQRKEDLSLHDRLEEAMSKPAASAQGSAAFTDKADGAKGPKAADGAKRTAPAPAPPVQRHWLNPVRYMPDFSGWWRGAPPPTDETGPGPDDEWYDKTGSPAGAARNAARPPKDGKGKLA